MDSKDTIIFINKDASKVSEIFLDEEWQIIKLIDNVYSIYVNNKEINWVVKVYDRVKDAKKESTNLNKLQNISGIPTILSASISKTFSYIILSKAPGIDLFEYSKRYGCFTEKNVKPIVKQLLSIIKDVHEQLIIHCDIKPENIVYDRETKKIVLIDFEGRKTNDYCSPEQVCEKEITTKTDMWSIGVTIYYLVYGCLPFRNKKEIITEEPFYSADVSMNFNDFLSCLIEKDEHFRYNVQEAINHEWLCE